MKKKITALIVAVFMLIPFFALKVSAVGAPYKGIDVSKWQTSVDWKKAKAAGVDFAVLRLYSNGKDTKFDEFYRGATAEGIWTGAYVYMYATNAAEAKSEAEGAVEALGGRSLDFPLFLDVEDSRQMKLGKSALTDLIIKELEVFRAAGYRTGIYTTQNYAKTYIDMSRLSGYDVWYAKWPLYAADSSSETYVFGDQSPNEKNPGCHIWQFSNGGDGATYGAASKFVDLDYCYFDYAGCGRSIYPYDSPDPDDYPVPSRTIAYKSGSPAAGCDVAWVQTIMCRLGYPMTVDGSYGPASEAAVKKFQAANGITTDGRVGAITRGKLLSLWDSMKKNLFKISFDPGEGNGSSPVVLAAAGESVATPADFSRQGFDLVGWRVFREDGICLTGEDPIPYGADVTTDPSWLSGGKTALTVTAVWLERVPGDADGDGDVTSKDVLRMRRYVAGLEDEETLVFSLADANSDGSVNAKDILIARRIIAGLD